MIFICDRSRTCLLRTCPYAASVILIQQSRLLALRSFPATVIISRILGNNNRTSFFVAGKRERERAEIDSAKGDSPKRQRSAMRRRSSGLFETRSGTRAAQDAFRESRKLNKVSSFHSASLLHFLAIVSFFYRPFVSRAPSVTVSSPFSLPHRAVLLVVPDKFAKRDSSPSTHM